MDSNELLCTDTCKAERFFVWPKVKGQCQGHSKVNGISQKLWMESNGISCGDRC